jgi:DNA-binding LytR/AlgR family response regulator
MVNCIIIDDEPHAIEGLKKYISKMPELLLLNAYTDPVLALEKLLDDDPVDLVFLDIDMPEISGIELAQAIRHKTKKLVFTTAHTKYGFEAFEVNADDYLLKPYSFAKFTLTLRKLFPKVEIEDYKSTSNLSTEGFFFIKSKGENQKLIKVKIENIVAVESQQNYIQIHTQDKTILTYMSLTEVSNKLTEQSGFLKFHRSFILNISYIESIEGNTIQMTNGKKITVGDFYRKDFTNFIRNKSVKSKKNFKA